MSLPLPENKSQATQTAWPMICGRAGKMSGSTWPSARLHVTEEGTRPSEGK